MYLCRGFLNSCCSLDVKVGFFGQLREFLGFRSTGLVSLISWRAQYKSSKCLPTRQQPSSKIRCLTDQHPTKTNNIKFCHLERSVQHRRKCCIMHAQIITCFRGQSVTHLTPFFWSRWKLGEIHWPGVQTICSERRRGIRNFYRIHRLAWFWNLLPPL